MDGGVRRVVKKIGMDNVGAAILAEKEEDFFDEKCPQLSGQLAALGADGRVHREVDHHGEA
jgi:hypothetical protein